VQGYPSFRVKIDGADGVVALHALDELQADGRRAYSTHPTSAVLSDGWYFAKRVTFKGGDIVMPMANRSVENLRFSSVPNCCIISL
jgi:hypothetical protein